MKKGQGELADVFSNMVETDKAALNSDVASLVAITTLHTQGAEVIKTIECAASLAAAKANMTALSAPVNQLITHTGQAISLMKNGVKAFTTSHSGALKKREASERAPGTPGAKAKAGGRGGGPGGGKGRGKGGKAGKQQAVVAPAIFTVEDGEQVHMKAYTKDQFADESANSLLHLGKPFVVTGLEDIMEDLKPPAVADKLRYFETSLSGGKKPGQPQRGQCYLGKESLTIKETLIAYVPATPQQNGSYRYTYTGADFAELYSKHREVVDQKLTGLSVFGLFSGDAAGGHVSMEYGEIGAIRLTYSGARRVLCIRLSKINELMEAASFPKTAPEHYSFGDAKNFMLGLTSEAVHKLLALEDESIACAVIGVGHAVFMPQGYMVFESSLNKDSISIFSRFVKISRSACKIMLGHVYVFYLSYALLIVLITTSRIIAMGCGCR